MEKKYFQKKLLLFIYVKTNVSGAKKILLTYQFGVQIFRSRSAWMA